MAKSWDIEKEMQDIINGISYARTSRECDKVMPATKSKGYPFSPVGYRGSNLNDL